jgi:hypothetical protein
VDLHAVASGYSPRHALELEHDVLSRFAVLCAKLLALLWLITGQRVYFRDTFVPFFGTTAFAASNFELVASCVVLAQLIAILTIVCSRFVRTGCALLAGIIFALALLDQPLFSNNRAFCAAVLAMLSLGDACFARYQVALVYGAAALDKLLSADWRQGSFLQTFTDQLCRIGALGSFDGAARPPLPITCWLAEHFTSSASFARWSSLTVIAIELAIAAGYATSSRATIPVVVGFHLLLLILTGSTFGIFFYACIAASLLVLDQRAANKPRT